MHVRQLEIKNFRAIAEQAIRFEDAMGQVRPITVLAGPNGSGKTSVLFAIVQALRGAMGYRSTDVPHPSDDDLHRTEPTGRRPVTASVQLDLVFEEAELNAIRRVFEQTRLVREEEGSLPLDPVPLPKGRLVVTWNYPPKLKPDGSRLPTSALWCDSPGAGGLSWLAGPKYAWRGWKRRLLSDLNDLYAVGMLRFFAQNRDTRWGIGSDSGDSGEPAENHTPDDSRGREEVTVVEALRRLGELAHGQGPKDDRELLLQKRFAQICAPKQYLGYWVDHPRYGATPLLEEDGREYPFRSAASGEHVILHYLTQFAFPRPVNNSIILIDEPELHLHPRWIRQLYRSLPQIGDNNQFVLTTHSPELRQLAAEDNALLDLGNLGEPSASVAYA